MKKYCKTKVDRIAVNDSGWHCQQNGHHYKTCHRTTSIEQSFAIIHIQAMKHIKGLRGRLQGTLYQSIWNNYIVLSMKFMKQRNAIITGNINGRNIAKPKLIEQQLVTPLDSRMDTPLQNRSQTMSTEDSPWLSHGQQLHTHGNKTLVVHQPTDWWENHFNHMT